MRLIAGLLVLLALSACASLASQSPVAPRSGIRGTVTAGPTCPVEIANSPCPPAVWTGTVRATASGGQRFETETDDQGNYNLPLSEGTYTVVPVTEGSGPPSAAPVSVSVTRGTTQTLDLQVDTGIR